MVTIDELLSALERVVMQAWGAGDLQLLQQALVKGEIAAATGERTMAMGGDASDLAIITGNGNVVNVYKGMNARILREVLGISDFSHLQECDPDAG